ncbi:ribosomal protein Ham1 (plasmid) [Legionella adelaidensis]|uniref:dITP/XTP pyrophosphatase n=1 Tax=Legionella adelaidensis TaxID=45056 RepID=A0A0W0R5J0_9GAMM|nr:RdgB/HAM1 family non-canonical purine NTP pyrophosphatase [Legionella adelaidensis]KTC66298.1 deoxyribonucleotide triphosphate pyrophosphatase [Legionella adelaidensis]VEH84894.1 ribosomal protein Ham1 [Legionella adelaidensis]
MEELILATSNSGKIAELKELLSPIHCIPQQELNIPDVEETGLTFIENAISKARNACALGKKPAIADDSGLVVKALDGAPGIYSARYAGKEANPQRNIELLLENMRHIKNREAYFYCAIVIVQFPEDPTPLITTGKLEGSITYEPKGSSGFGYDPVFLINGYQCTVAELPLKIKNTVSHRARALQQLRFKLHSFDL